jgi:hypothetical protein
LLFVLLMAAVVAISLYKQLPRVAFDTQRQKEQMLIERGEQYKRAIQLFLRANNNTRWPATIDELENFNGKRFLRHRYKDPMTGKDEWRLVHIANGVLTDSILNKPKQTNDPNATDQSQYLTQQASIGSQANQDNGQGNISAATRRRASEGGVQLGPDGQPLPPGGGQPGFPGAPTDPNAPNPIANGAPFPAGMPGMPGVPGMPGQAPGQGGQPGGFPGATSPGGSTSPNNSSGSGYLSSLPSMGSGSSTSTPTTTSGMGAPVNSQVGGVSPYNSAAAPNGISPGFGQPGMPGSPQGQSAAAGLINNLLTQPRPGGLAGLSGQGQQQGQVIGGGIAGIASKVKGESIMVYGDHSDYSEWEFNWDPTKWAPPPNPNQSTVGTPISQIASPNSGTPGATPNASPFGASPNGAGTPGGSSFGGPATPPGGTQPNGAPGQSQMGGFGAGGLPPTMRPGVP